MSVAAICRSSTAVPLPLEKEFLMPTPFAASKTWLPSGADTVNGINPTRGLAVIKNEEQGVGGEEKTAPAQLDIWTSIRATNAKEPKVDEPYVHPLMRRSSSLMSQRSLEVCTESLGSETGSDDFFSSDDDMEYWFSARSKNKQVVVQQQEEQEKQVVVQQQQEEEEEEEEEQDEAAGMKWKEQATVNYHCSISSSRRSPYRSFPPPLPSISRRDGRCFQMRPRRRDGRLVVEAVAVPSQNYLRAERQDGRLLLSFINTTPHPPRNSNTTASDILTEQTPVVEEEEEEEEEEVMEVEDQEGEEEEEEEEEEVEVVDRGTVVEVKVSTQPQQQSGGSAAMKVHRSSIVINKFVSCTSSQLSDKENDQNAINSSSDDYATAAAPSPTAGRRSTNTTTTAAAAAVAASSLSTLPADGSQPSFDNKLLFTSKRRNREELLRDMSRCSQLRKPLFIWEPTCIATSS